jgi:hypothetical protein
LNTKNRIKRNKEIKQEKEEEEEEGGGGGGGGGGGEVDEEEEGKEGTAHVTLCMQTNQTRNESRDIEAKSHVKAEIKDKAKS